MEKTNQQIAILNSYDSAVKINAAYKYQANHNKMVNSADIAAIEKIYAEAYSRFNSYASQVSKKHGDKEKLVKAKGYLERIRLESITIDEANMNVGYMFECIPMAARTKATELDKLYSKILNYCDSKNITIQDFAKELVDYYS